MRLVVIALTGMLLTEASVARVREPWENITTEADERPNAERIKEIAAWLPEKPAATAPRISDRAAWERLAKDAGAAKLIGNAEKCEREPIPEVGDYHEFMRNGNRTRYESTYFRRLSALSTLILAECVENRGRFLDGVVRYLKFFCEAKSWSSPAHDREKTNWDGSFLHGDLTSTERAMVLGTGVYILEEKLPPELVADVKREIKRRILDNYLEKNDGRMKRKGVSGNWWLHARENWNAVCNANVVRAALAVVESREERAVFVEAEERAVKYYLEGFSSDGYCSEGMGYWNYGFGHYLQAGLTIRVATGGKVDVFAHERARAAVEYAYGFQLQNGFSPHFADGGGRPCAAYLEMARMVFPDLADERATKTRLLDGDYGATLILGFLPRPKPEKLTREILPARSYFSDAQVLIARCEPAAAKDGRYLALAIKGGHNQEQHNHNDLGSYTISMDGAVATGDPGGEIYTRRTFNEGRYLSDVLNSYGHPVPLVNGKKQLTGRKAAAKVISTSFEDERDEIVYDLTAGYDEKSLVSLTRTAVFDRRKLTVEIRDRVEFSEPCAFETPVITYATVSADYDKGHYSLQLPAAKCGLDLVVTAEGGDWHMEGRLLDNPQKPSPVRLAAVFDAPVTKAEIVTRFSMKGKK